MTRIIPFKGILYNTERINVEDVLAPPYDIITPELREELYNKSPYNIVRIDFGKDFPNDNSIENKYTRAKKLLKEWLLNKILIQNNEPSFYAYSIEFVHNGIKKSIIGFLGLVRLEELGKGNIYPHECTYSKPKKDRLNLLKECKANTSPIFSLYRSDEMRTHNTLLDISMNQKPYIVAKDKDGFIHRLWQIKNKKEIEIITNELEDKPIFIADGHHRYETAYELHKEMKKSFPNRKTLPSDYVLMFLVNMHDKGITILPTHRLIKDMPKNIETLFSNYFDINPIKEDFNVEKFLLNKKGHFGFFENKEELWYLLRYRGGNLNEVHPDVRDIDVIILHELILKKLLHTIDIGYEMNIDNALSKVRAGEYNAVFFLNPTTVDDVEKAALSLTRMPPKSTYFYPKLLTGLVINKWGSD